MLSYPPARMDKKPFTGIDFFSDTLTQPTPAMKQAMVDAPLGDEQKGEDPTTLALEERIAALLGKSSALFFPSATMANEVAIRALCERGDELIAADNCHLFVAEAGGPAVHAGVMIRPVPTANGVFTGAEIKNLYRWSKGPLYPATKMVSVENTTNMGGGVPWTREGLRDITSTCRELDLRLHMDGARFFNASVASRLSPSTMAEGFDAITICLSKGLGCAAGAVLVFDKARYDVIRRLKQLMGGCLRQSGMLAAAGLYALDHHVERLAEDHENAARLANGLARMSEIELENAKPATNIVFFRWTGKGSQAAWLQRCTDHGVRFSQVGENRFRAVTHLGIRREDIDRALEIVQGSLSERS